MTAGRNSNAHDRRPSQPEDAWPARGPSQDGLLSQSLSPDRRLEWIAFAGCAAASLALSFVMRLFYYDDAYTYLRFAENLAFHHTFGLNPGEPAYAVSSPLWTLLLTAVRWMLPVSRDGFVLVVKILGALMTGAAAAVTLRTLEGVENGRRVAWAVCLALLVVPFLTTAWVGSGMECPLTILAASILVHVAATPRLERWTGVAAGVMVLSRLDHVIFGGVFVAMVLWGRWRAAAPGQPIIRLRLLLLHLLSGACLLIPWELYTWTRLGAVMPWTRVGRLSIYLPEGLTMHQFEALPLLRHVSLAMGAFARLAFGSASSAAYFGLPLILAIAAVVAGRPRGRGGLLARALLTAVAVQTAVYAWSFPIVARRHLVIVPFYCAVVAILAYVNRKDVPMPTTAGRPWTRGAAIAMVALLAVTQYGLTIAWIRKFDGGVESLRALADVLSKTSKVVALVPIGIVGYYTDCRIVDLGALADREYSRLIYDGVSATRAAEYARLKGADHALWPDSSRSQFEEGIRPAAIEGTYGGASLYALQGIH